MTKEEMTTYKREYRREGFGRICDRKYYMKNRETILEKQRVRDRARAILARNCETFARFD